MSRRWGEQLKRLLRPIAQENRKARCGDEIAPNLRAELCGPRPRLRTIARKC